MSSQADSKEMDQSIRQTDDLPTYQDATVDETKVPLLESDEKKDLKLQSQPQAVQPPVYQKEEGVEEQELTNDYSTGLFECFSDPKTAALAYFCPCVTSGIVNATVAAHDSVDEESVLPSIAEEPKWYHKALHALPYSVMVLCGPPCGFNAAGLFQRWTVRAQYGLERHLIRDCMAHTFCHCCAMAQDHREVKIREERQRAEYQRVQQLMEHDL